MKAKWSRIIKVRVSALEHGQALGHLGLWRKRGGLNRSRVVKFETALSQTDGGGKATEGS